MRHLTRRDWLKGSLAATGLLAVPDARAEVRPADRKFVFVQADGGWDVTKVFTPMWSSAIHHDPAEAAASAGPLTWVTHPLRPAVDRFFRRYADRIGLIDGIMVRSVNHPVCRAMWMTNSPDARFPDWPTLIAFEGADRYVVPQLIVSGNQMSADLSAYTAFSGIGSSLDRLLTGAAMAESTTPSTPLPPALERLVHGALTQRVAARLETARTPVERQLYAAHLEAALRLGDFQAATAGLDMTVADELAGQVDLAVSVLQHDISRCVQLRSSGTLHWDTHADNDNLQSGLFQMLFAGLEHLMDRLEQTPGTVGETLLDETTIVVHSEMGRTPYLNLADGKEHWMFTSAMLLGAGVRGGHRAGGYDEGLNGLAVDPGAGAPDPAGVQLSPVMVGSTLLSLAGVDPERYLTEDRTIVDLLA
ncbi:MAG: DUF1501 domain-containing protein [Alphaproteobacteria bacterium]|nr:DUF1501 domain-containing protein [Alphaproteobacteria bacterium]